MPKRPADDSAGSSKRKHLTLSIQKKVEILRKLDKGMSVKKLSDEFNIGLSTVYDIRKQKDKILSFYGNSDVPELMDCRKTVHQARNIDVEKVLLEWIRQRRTENFPLDRATIMAQARKLHAELGMSECEYSTGWFTKFKRRYGLRLLKISGEKSSADVDGAEAFCKELSQIIKNENLTLDQLYNADETSLFWRYIPRKTYATSEEKNPSGYKDCKERLTILACANAAGNHKCKLMIIGKSRNPRAFKNVKVFPAIYRSNKCAWITRELFKEWFENHFVPEATSHCRSVGLPENSKILLLIDNCSAHPKAEILRKDNVIVCFLPPNCTSLIQPMDQGVLRSLKCIYKKEFLEKMLDACNSDCHGIEEFRKKFTIKDAIWNAAKAWNKIKSDTLKNAWHNLMPNTIFNDDSDDEDEIFEGFHISKEKELVQELLEYAKTGNSGESMLDEIAINDCFNADNNAPVVLQLTDAEIIDSVLNKENETEKDEEDEDDETSTEVSEISNEKCIALTEELIRAMEQKSFVDETHIMHMYKIQELFLKQKQKRLKQTKLTDLFKK